MLPEPSSLKKWVVAVGLYCDWSCILCMYSTIDSQQQQGNQRLKIKLTVLFFYLQAILFPSGNTNLVYFIEKHVKHI